jgi:putative FmdB family regulatory protein
MPIYDYKCKKCCETTSIEKSMNDIYIPVCKTCGSSEVSRIWGKIQLKGCAASSEGTTSSSCRGCSKTSCTGCG